MYLAGTDQMTVKRPDHSGPMVAPTVPFGLDLCRLADIVLSILVLIFMAPLMVVTALLIKLQDGGPVLFGHTRLGRDGKTFKCWKFRSMVVDAEARLSHLLANDPKARAEWDASQKLRNDPRTTRFGSFLRTSSLDEFPQLFNVLLGEMSLVGPRPIVLAEVARYGRWYRHYCRVRPGVTGLWQISGRSDTTYAQRVAYDVMFARRASFGLYLKILAATVPVVLARAGSY